MRKNRKAVAAAAFATVLLLIVAVIQCHQQSKNHLRINTEDLPWYLTLVNNDYPVPKWYAPQLLTLSNGQRIDERIYPDLQAMFDAARKDGLDLQAASGYRTKQQQQAILNARIREYEKEGCGKNQAEKAGQAYVALPDHSEHQLGLAIDIQVKGKTNADVLYDWLEAHAHTYGFIQRYPENRTEITGFSFERWHYRYVGKKAAEVIYQQDLTLEEYLSL